MVWGHPGGLGTPGWRGETQVVWEDPSGLGAPRQFGDTRVARGPRARSCPGLGHQLQPTLWSCPDPPRLQDLAPNLPPLASTMLKKI